MYQIQIRPGRHRVGRRRPLRRQGHPGYLHKVWKNAGKNNIVTKLDLFSSRVGAEEVLQFIYNEAEIRWGDREKDITWILPQKCKYFFLRLPPLERRLVSLEPILPVLLYMRGGNKDKEQTGF